MIRPTKHMDVNTCVLRIASVITKELLETPAMSLNELDELVQERVGDMSRFNFIPALNFLFLIGILDYQDDTDTISSMSQVS